MLDRWKNHVLIRAKFFATIENETSGRDDYIRGFGDGEKVKYCNYEYIIEISISTC